ncbi:MAG: glycine cleavage system protein GcvH [Myxococcota bacterium]|nr:glycine cleavage system protein GcvH [Myxococcota bacterium]
MAEYEISEEMNYTRSDEWVRLEGSRATVGISDYAQHQLGDIVFVELPESGTELAAGEAFGVVESVKAVSDLYAPVAGKVVEVNESLSDSPEQINASAYGEGWLLVLECADPSQVEGLLDAEAYRAHVAQRDDAA